MVVDLLDASGADPEATALIAKDGVWTYRELEGVVNERAQAFRESGVETEHVVPIVLDADVDGVLSLLALWRVGATPAPLSQRLTEPERATAVRALRDAPPGAQALLWTSGTAGRPRGVALSFDGLSASAYAAADRLQLTDEDVWLASLSPAHVGGLALVTRSILLGGRLVSVGPFRAERASDLLEGRGLPDGVDASVTHLALVPTQLLALLDIREGAPPPDTFRCALIGGAHAPADLVARALRDGWPVALTYGLTETTSQVATAPPSLTGEKPGTVGRALQGVDVQVGEDGEIRVRGPTLAVGYVGAGEDTLADGDGWHHTGDFGRFDADGHLWVTGRRADRIVSGGVTIDAVEVEEALRSHPAVLDACVVGVPDAEWGETVGAWIVPVWGEFHQDAVDSYLRERLSAPKLPRVYHLDDSVPRNENGKLDRAAVRDVLTAGQ